VAIGDLREFMSALEATHEIRTVDGADWDLEIGAITELNFEREGPALLFDNIKGYPKGYRILCNAVETLPRALLALGLPTNLDTDAAIAQYEAKLAGYAPVPETEVPSGPILENSYFGDDVDLLKFPSPRWHEADGGRYIGTGSMVIMRDPDTGEVNLGTYRVMVHDKNTAGLFIVLAHTGAQIERKYWARGQSCPVAVCLGEDPLLFLCSAA
jgi:UbiD family decarboxylase